MSSSTQDSFVDSVVAAARENPVAAALIGGGALWLLMGSDKLKRAASSAAATAFPSTDTSVRRPQPARSEYEATPAPPTAPDMDHGSFGLGASVRHAGNSVSDAVSNASDAMKGRFDEGAAYARDNVGKLGEILPGKEALSSSLSDLLERQPLVLGAVGLAIGAAVAGAFRSLDLENEMVGEYSDSFKEDVIERAGAVSQSVFEASDTLRNEIKEAGAETLEKVEQSGMDAAQAAGQRVKTA